MPRANGPSLVARVRRTLGTRNLARRGSSVLVAVSGGPDSIAMLDVLHRLSGELDLTLSVASVDHGLRPEAAGEVAFVGARAVSLGLRFRPIALGLAPGSSHATARTARYAALSAAAADFGAVAIAVGHTRDDQAETVLSRLMRGSGLRGLRGVLPARADGVIRPLLDATRLEVEAHNRQYTLEVVSDPSNLDRRYLRVRVRHDLLPELVRESPSVVDHLAAIADEAADFSEFVEDLAVRFRETSGTVVSRDALESLPKPARAAAIAEFVRFHVGRAPSRAVVESVLDAVHDGGSVWIGGEFVLEGASGALELKTKSFGVQRSASVRRPKE